MSQKRTEEITCPKCGAKGPFTVWDSVNVEDSPSLRGQLMDESIFVWTCPDCGHTVYVTFSTLYHDSTNQFLLFFDHKTGDKDIEDSPFPDGEAFEQFNKTYRLRFVHGINNLKEKIFIFEEGLNDIVIELLKYFIRNGIIAIQQGDGEEKGQPIPGNYFIGRAIYFTQMSADGEQLIFSIARPRGGVESHFALSMDLYSQCLQKLALDKRFKEDRNSIKNVCYEWVEARLKTPVEES